MKARPPSVAPPVRPPGHGRAPLTARRSPGAARPGPNASTGSWPRERRGDALADNLLALRLDPLAPALRPYRQQLLDSVAAHLANPSTVSQGTSEVTCVPAAVQHALARTQPAEYVRIVRGLASPAGVVELSGGGVLRRPAHLPRHGRTLTDALFQQAALNLAASPEAQTRGLDAAEACALLAAVFGRPYRSYVREEAPRLVRALRSRPTGPAVLALRLDRSGRFANGVHAVLASGSDTERFSYFDPLPAPPLPGSEERADTSGERHCSLPWSSLGRRLEFAALPGTPGPWEVVRALARQVKGRGRL